MDNNIESSFDAIPFYQKHPYMKPFIGERFDSELHKKLLIVGESHYLQATSTVHLNIDDWYAGNCDVSDEEKEWCNTRNSRKYGYGKIFQQLIEGDLREHFGADFNDVASFNYFLRPSNKGKTFKKICNIKDRSASAENFYKVVEILKPDLIVFASKFVFDCIAWKNDYPNVYHEKFEEYAKRKNIEIVMTCHPSNGWWHRFYGEKTSSQIFVDFLRKYWLK